MTQNDRPVYRTKSGKVLTSADIDALADELANADYDLDAVKARPVRPPRTQAKEDR